MTEQELYQAALNKWGIPSQIDMLLEECCELIHAAHKHNRGKLNNLPEELVDASICIEQVKNLFPGKFEAIKQQKLERLAGLLGTTYEPGGKVG